MQRRVLLATNLSADCDRALDRAILLTREWRARLMIAIALDDWGYSEWEESAPTWRRAKNSIIDAKRQIRDDLSGTGIDANVIVERAPAPEMMGRLVSETYFDLVVVGLSQATGFTRALRGITLETILRRSFAPVLVVKRRVQRQYDSIAVGSDFSENSRAALRAASAFFPQSAITVVHACRESSALRNFTKYQKQCDEAISLAATKCERFVAESMSPMAGEIGYAVGRGAPGQVLSQYAAEHNADLIAVGTRGRHPLLNLVCGSTSRALVSSSRCDLLVVPHKCETVNELSSYKHFPRENVMVTA